MGITKRQLADLVRDDMSGGRPGDVTKFRYLTIYKKIELARNELIMRNFYEHRNENSYDINGDFITSFCPVEIEFDEKRCEYYSDLPAKVISLPDNRGIRQVSEIKGQKTPFIKMVNGAVGTFGCLEAGGLGGATGYYPEGDRIYYVNKPDSIDEVLMKLVASVDDLDEDENLPIPAEYEKILYDTVKQMMLEKLQIPEDKINDSNNQTPG